MHTYFFNIFLLLATLCSSTAHAAKITFEQKQVDEKTLLLKVAFNLEKNEWLYKEALTFSVDSPLLQLSEWHCNQDPINSYDETTKSNKIVFDGLPIFSLYAKKQEKNITSDVFLHIGYLLNTTSSPVQELFKLKVGTPTTAEAAKQYTAVSAVQESPTPKNDVTSVTLEAEETSTSWSTKISDLVTHTQSLPMRLMLVFLLGLLMSLTPCIYPMIPITVGILNAQKSNSFLRNLLLSLSYTIGLSTTFACFGLLAGYSGAVYGKLLSNPLFVLVLVAFLLYLAFSMFGFYELRIPRFLQGSNKVNSNSSGSVITAFLFGAASGTISSPCVSPGLILLLSVVAQLGSTALGFLLLFFFGVGLSTPLFLVGTFSSSLNVLPRAGMWMIEVKKIFGIMLIGVCLYYLQNILPESVVMALGTLCLLLIAIYYLYNAQYNLTTNLKRFHNLAAFAFLVSAIVAGVHTAQSIFYTAPTKEIAWISDYEAARQKALDENKLLFVDCWADYCSICKAINNSLLKNSLVIDTVSNSVVPLNVNGTDESTQTYQTMKNKFNVVGFPTFLLIDPKEEKILRKWNSELYHVKAEDFIAIIKGA